MAVVLAASAAAPLGAAETARLDLQAAEFAGRALAPATVEAYARDLARFERWCALRGETPLPASPATLARYLSDCATALAPGGGPACSPASLGRWVASVNYAHRAAGLAPPGRHPHVEAVLSGIRRDRRRPPRRMGPLLLDDVRAVNARIARRVAGSGPWPGAVAARRDSALLLMGFVGAYRRSELAGLLVGDVAPHREDGLHVRLASSKNDQEGAGLVKALPFGTRPDSCAPCAYARWLDALAAHACGRAALMRAVMADGAPGAGSEHCCKAARRLEPALLAQPLFRPVGKSGAIADRAMSGHAVNLVVKRRAADAGYPAADLGGHSLRAGLVTQAFRSGADPHSIMRQTGHKSIAMLEVYAREHAPLTGNAVTRIGL